MSRPTLPAYKTGNWPAYNEARKRDYRGAAIRTCLTMKGEGRPEIRPVDGFQPCTGEAPGQFGMALRQTTGFVESLLDLLGLDWAVPNLGTPSRRQKTLQVNIPYRGSEGPLHLLIDIAPASATGRSREGILCKLEYTRYGRAKRTNCPPVSPRRFNALSRRPNRALVVMRRLKACDS